MARRRASAPVWAEAPGFCAARSPNRRDRSAMDCRKNSSPGCGLLTGDGPGFVFGFFALGSTVIQPTCFVVAEMVTADNVTTEGAAVTNLGQMTLLSGGAIASSLPAAAQAGPPVVASLVLANLQADQPIIDALRQGLRRLGYVEGHTIVVEAPEFEGDE